MKPQIISQKENNQPQVVNKIILVNIRGNIYPMSQEQYKELQSDTDWLVDMFRTF